MDKFKFDKNTDDLLRAILSLENIKETEKFFRDLCTVEEIKAMSERWQIVRLLEQGLPYRTIAEKTDASTTTVSRVATWFNNGEGGYKLALNKLNSHHNTSKAIGKC
jgi:TrpR-related protein YerC/YecD